MVRNISFCLCYMPFLEGLTQSINCDLCNGLIFVGPRRWRSGKMYTPRAICPKRCLILIKKILIIRTGYITTTIFKETSFNTIETAPAPARRKLFYEGNVFATLFNPLIFSLHQVFFFLV